jgi:hypothetical protein
MQDNGLNATWTTTCCSAYGYVHFDLAVQQQSFSVDRWIQRITDENDLEEIFGEMRETFLGGKGKGEEMNGRPARA